MPKLQRNWPTLPAMMLALGAEWADRPLFRYWHGGAWQSLRWGDFALRVASVAAFLRAKGVGPGDRVMLVSENRPEFPIADTAIMAIGAVTVPTYTTNLAADHAHILRDSGARTAIVSTRRLAEKVLEGAALANGLDLLITFEDPPTDAGLLAHGWAEAIATPGDVAALHAEAEAAPTDSLACLIYTSGTGGLPKGVMLPHRALLANRAGVVPLAERLGLEGKPYLSFLPLSHSYEHTVGGFLLPSVGMEVVYSRGADRLSHELAEIRPAVLTAVPRLFEVLRGRILQGLEKESAFKRRLFDRTVELGLRKMDGPPLGLFEKLQDLVLDRLVRTKTRARFGGELLAMVSGGARLDPDLSGFFLALGLPVLQGYGQTEAGPVVSVNLPWANHRHTVGPPLQGVELRIAEDGEVLVRGDLVMTGYWNNPEATAAALRPPVGESGDWLHTGDVGVLEDGYLRITDRKRDFIKTLGGDMVSPAKVESLLMAEPEVHQAVVAGEGKPGIVALVVPADGMADKVAEAVRRVNGKLATIERIRHFAVTEPFTIDNGLLTPTMKVKRRAAIEARTGEFERLWG
ncbi:AMP-dependent synthetase/ligase [Neoroseomonas oryzicola]|uniref:Long-chain fatty acid--CoA ligase n=1 Tax=Neoroseomonas oryzicola TaxID=535904 RepID=A0A9X9WNB6_9PROT|nr:long-chain fatty acid--CoA ligase [Neoroseomonas oryzicola]MBR0661826.1 long-chain fatty acid--CoA ligase [Neoroseomonas oryzicola]NKE20047.1 long-chain fatty acid--CoA ligase [Neoroseomonas oryzicola]